MIHQFKVRVDGDNFFKLPRGLKKLMGARMGRHFNRLVDRPLQLGDKLSFTYEFTMRGSITEGARWVMLEYDDTPSDGPFDGLAQGSK